MTRQSNSPTGPRRAVKATLGILVIVSAVCAYFATSLGIASILTRTSYIFLLEWGWILPIMAAALILALGYIVNVLIDLYATTLTRHYHRLSDHTTT